ncbi:uncharacterized protein PHACADRAFT_69052, partial [Phanerochaete carnosa HHB-10118-sp]
LITAAAGLLARYKCTKEPEDLEKFMSLSKGALELCPPSTPLFLTAYNALFPALIEMFERKSEGLEECVHFCSLALDLCPPGHRDRPHSLISLAVAKLAHFKFTSRQEDMDDSITSLREAIELL